MALENVNREDLAGAMKRAGAARTFIDSQDYEAVMRHDLAIARLAIDDQDLSQLLAPFATDTTVPLVSGFSPLDNAVGVSVNVAPTVTFDTAIVFTATIAKNFTLKKTADNSVIEAWEVAAEEGSGAGQCEISGNSVILHLTAPLAAATEYYIIWDAGVVLDLSGNPIAAQASTTAWSFTTA